MSRNIFLPAPEARIFSAMSSPLTMKDACLGSSPGLCFPCQRVLLVVATNARRCLKRSKRFGCTVSTMVLSEARGLVLFRVVRGGIGFTQRLGAQGTVLPTGV